MKAKKVNQTLNENYDDYNEEIIEEPMFNDADIVEDDIYYDDIISDEIASTINNELDVPEYARREISFKLRGVPGVIDGVPMAKMSDGKSYLMKIDGKYKKINIDNIIEESIKIKRNKDLNE